MFLKIKLFGGGNYFPFLWKNGNKGFVFWYKHQPVNNWADGELAWTSFNKPAKCFDFSSFGNVNQDKDRFHPTQKPIKLYKWLLKNYANEGDKILDTHGGSMSITIACNDMGFDLDICEMDEDYFNDAVKRFENHIKQLVLF